MNMSGTEKKNQAQLEWNLQNKLVLSHTRHLRIHIWTAIHRSDCMPNCEHVVCVTSAIIMQSWVNCYTL